MSDTDRFWGKGSIIGMITGGIALITAASFAMSAIRHVTGTDPMTASDVVVRGIVFIPLALIWYGVTYDRLRLALASSAGLALAILAGMAYIWSKAPFGDAYAATVTYGSAALMILLLLFAFFEIRAECDRREMNL